MIISEEYLYKSTEYVNLEDGESARLYAVALAAHGELEMAKQIFKKSFFKTDNIPSYNDFNDWEYEDYFQKPPLVDIVEQLWNDFSSNTFLPPLPKRFDLEKYLMDEFGIKDNTIFLSNDM